MSIAEAIKGARAELAQVHSPLQRVQRLAVYARIFAAELFGTVLAVPFGLRAFSLHRSLPDARRGTGAGTVSILRDVRYGARPRNLMDIYLPPNIEFNGSLEGQLEGGQQPGGAGDDIGTASAAAASTVAANGAAADDAGGAAAAAGGAPVVLFCHGGVWAAGSAWHYAPLATRLAQAGVITAVMQYSLYPQALVPQMVAEVSRALTWTLDNAAQLGGSPQQVSLMGHSAGAQMCTMALLHRALSASKAAEQRQAAAATAEGLRGSGRSASNGSSSSSKAVKVPAPLPAQASAAAAQEQQRGQQQGAEGAEAAAYADHRMPKRLVAVAGVFDLGKHYEYEEARHVHKLSTMERAIDSPHLFPSQSPAVILANALRRQRRLPAQHASWEALQANPRELLQEAGISERSGSQWGSAWDSLEGGWSSAEGECSGLPAAAGPHCALVRPPAQRRQVQAQEEATAGSEAVQPSPPAMAAARYYQSFELSGEAIARRIGFDRVAAAEAAAADAAADAAQAVAAAGGGPAAVEAAAAAARRAALAVCPPVVPAAAGAGASIAGGTVEEAGIMQLTVEAARRLPPTVLASSCTDVTVPWYESAEMYWMLHDCGVPAKHLVYSKVGHADFVTEWAALPRISGQPAADESDLAPHAADLVKIVSGRARVRWSS